MNQTIFPSGQDYAINRSIMVVGSHADDNEIHCGGTMLKYRDRGYDIIYVQSTNNMSGSFSELDENGKVRLVGKPGPIEMSKRRKSECESAAAMLGIKPIHLDHPQRHYNGPNGEQIKLTFGSELPEGVPANTHTILTAHEDEASLKRLADLILEHEPELVLTHSVTQRNIEHFATSLLVTNAYWKAVDQGYKGGLLHWREAILHLGDLNCRWDTFVDYTPYLDRKMELVHCHYCQVPGALDPHFGHRRLAKWWGSVCGCGAAEVFTWVNRPTHRNSFGPVPADITMELLTNSR